MRIKETIRQKASQTLDTLIPPNQWEAYIDLLDRNGKFTRIVMLRIIIQLCQQVELLENLVEEAYFQLEMQQGVRATKEEFKLRTPFDVTNDLDAEHHPNTIAYYVSPADWKILEKNIDPELAKTKPEYGYGKEKDPKDGREKTCMYYKELPIFKTLK